MLDQLALKKKGLWKDRLLDYTHGNEEARDQAMRGMKYAGSQVGIAFDYNVYIDRQPVDSQRMLLYAARHGKQEAYVSALSRRHFTQGSSGESASRRHTVLAAAEEAGLDPQAASSFYDGDELRDVVWRSYGDMPKRGISAIPLFVFNVPEINVEGGPLRPHAKGTHPPIVNGSMNAELFGDIFDDLWSKLSKHRKAKALEAKAPPKAPPMPAARGPHAALLAEIATRGGDVPSLLALAARSSDSAELQKLGECLAKLGYAKLGERLKVGSALAEVAATAAAGGAAAGGAATATAVVVPAAVAALIGQRVALSGLRSKPALNGCVGVCERFDASSARCVVRLDGASEAVLLKAANLSLAAEEAAAAPTAPPTADDDGDDDDDALAIYGF